MVSERDAWLAAAIHPEVEEAMREMIAEAAESVGARRPLCVSRGACCDFERFGHQLWMSGLEVAWCVRRLASPPTLDEIDRATRQGSCPFLQGGLCGIHWARPLGCRAFFCDGAGEGWQEALLESWHGRVRDLHGRLEVPYRYDEWRRLLRVFASHA